MTENVGVYFDGMRTAEKVYEDLRRRPEGVQMPQWHTLSSSEQAYFAHFADCTVLRFVEQMSAAGIKTETHLIQENGVKA